MATGLGRRPAGEAPPPAVAARRSRRRLAILPIAALVVLVDQASKTWALNHARVPVHVVGTLRLAVTFNSGTAFGLGQDSTAIIVAGVVVLVVVLLGLGRKASRGASWPGAVAMGLLLGGAIGNLTDRLVRHLGGAVVDFIDLRWWPVFNVADASITVGAALLAVVLFRARPEASGSGDTPPAGSPLGGLPRGGSPPGESPPGGRPRGGSPLGGSPPGESGAE
jgi:signal peptidase II